jgi:hypothetical protein
MLLEREEVMIHPKQDKDHTHRSPAGWRKKGRRPCGRRQLEILFTFSPSAVYIPIFFFIRGDDGGGAIQPSSSHQHDKFIGYNATTTALIPLDFS